VSTFGMKHSSCLLFSNSFNVELSTFLKPFVSKLCATQGRELSLVLEMGMSGKWGEGGRRGEAGRREVGGEIFGVEKGPENLWAGKRMCFWFIPKMAWTASSSIGALVVVGLLQPLQGLKYLSLTINKTSFFAKYLHIYFKKPGSTISNLIV